MYYNGLLCTRYVVLLAKVDCSPIVTIVEIRVENLGQDANFRLPESIRPLNIDVNNRQQQLVSLDLYSQTIWKS